MIIDVRGRRIEIDFIGLEPDEGKWGEECKSGYKYKIALNKIICPYCRKRINSYDIRHKMIKHKSKDRWINFCKFCNGHRKKQKRFISDGKI